MGGSRVQGACPRPDSLQFVLRYKRLHRALFSVPRAADATASSVRIDAVALAQLLAGVAKEAKRRVLA
jgi:hypothetical protein